MHIVPVPPAAQLELIRPPAPGQLEVVRRFLNTRDVEAGTDELGSAAALLAWIREHGLVQREATVRATGADVARVAAVREALRALVRRNNDVRDACDSVALDAAGARSRFTMRFDGPDNTATIVPTAPGIDGAVGRMLATVHLAMLDGSWARLKACADDTCDSAYYDRSKNGCSRWCSTEICGNRSKVKRYRERQRAAPGRAAR